SAAVVLPSDLALCDVDANAAPQQRSAGRHGGNERSETVERERLLQALHEANWNLSAAAGRLEIPRNTLWVRMERHGLRPPPPSRQRSARPSIVPSPPALPTDAQPATSFPSPLARERLSSSAVRWERRRITLVRADFSVGLGTVFEADMSR